MAADSVSALRVRLGVPGAAQLCGMGATRREGASRRPDGGIGHETVDGMQPTALVRHAGDGSEETGGIGVMILTAEQILQGHR